MPIFSFTTADDKERLALAQAAVDPWRAAWPEIVEKLHRHTAQQFPDTSLPNAFSEFLRAGAIDAALAMMPFVGPSAVDNAFVTAANNNLTPAVLALLPHVVGARPRRLALASYLNVSKPRDTAIFDALLPYVDPKQAGSDLLTAAVRSRHWEIAARLVPLSEPWASARTNTTNASVLEGLARVWSQSIAAGKGPLLPPGDRSAAHWAQQLPGVSEALRARHLETAFARRKKTATPAPDRTTPRL